MWKIDVAPDKNDLKAEREKTASLFKEKFEKLTEAQLSDLLKYTDMRIRLKAQYELAPVSYTHLDVYKRQYIG